MENSIEDWTRFAKHVENQLVLMDETYSKAYLGSVQTLVHDLQDKVTQINKLDLVERQKCFLQINRIGSELKTTAHFARFDMGIA